MDILAKTNDGGVSNMAVGTFTADGTAANVNCGFMPRSIKLINITDLVTYELTNEMVAGKALKQVAAGTLTNDTANITIKSSRDNLRGFTVPAAIAVAGKVFHFVAHG